MNDYIIDERVMKDIRDATQSNKEGPPEKIPAQNNTMLVSRDASLKKGYNDLDHKYKNLETAYNKLEKKYNDVQEESKQLKSTCDNLFKDVNIFLITNEKIMAEKLNLETTVKENKVYIRELESRLVNDAQNQYLVEINNKLRKDLEDIKKVMEEKNIEIEKLKNDLPKKNQEIKNVKIKIFYFIDRGKTF
jgi:predicted nuclease with TOPRIM domain